VQPSRLHIRPNRVFRTRHRSRSLFETLVENLESALEDRIAVGVWVDLFNDFVGIDSLAIDDFVVRPQPLTDRHPDRDITVLDEAHIWCESDAGLADDNRPCTLQGCREDLSNTGSVPADKNQRQAVGDHFFIGFVGLRAGLAAFPLPEPSRADKK